MEEIIMEQQQQQPNPRHVIGALTMMVIAVIAIIAMPEAGTIDALDPVTYYATPEATADPDRFNENQDIHNSNLQAIGTAIQTLEDATNPYTPIYHAGAILNMSIETAAEDEAIEVGFLKYSPLTSPPTPGNGEWSFQPLDDLQATPGWTDGTLDGVDLNYTDDATENGLLLYVASSSTPTDGEWQFLPATELTPGPTPTLIPTLPPPTPQPYPTQEVPVWGTETPAAGEGNLRYNTDTDSVEYRNYAGNWRAIGS